jgi:predicted HTH domain antitoxin
MCSKAITKKVRDKCNGEVDVMRQIVLELSDDLARQIGGYQERLQELVLLGLSQLKAQEALTLYTRGIVSFARAAEIAGLSRPEMVRQARALGIRPRWSEQMVEEELA